MYKREEFYRGTALGSEQRSMPAAFYNEMRLLYQRNETECVFVPVRALQYMAVIDNEEVIFVDIHFRRVIEFSWQAFKPQSRSGLNCPVEYECTWYNRKAADTMLRMPTEFSAAVHRQLQRLRKQEKSSDSKLLSFPLENQ